MNASSEVVKTLARDKEKKSIAEYTELLLQKTDLSSAEKIKLVHFNQTNRLDIIKRVQKHTLDNVFLKNPNTFFTKAFHYDWWIFPMHVPKEWGWEQRNYDASISLGEAETLLRDSNFIKTYTQCVALYIHALEEHGWNNYPVRYARMLNSLSLFLKASSQLHMEDEHNDLCQLGQEAIIFAQENINWDGYTLFITGFNEVKEFVSLASSSQGSRLRSGVQVSN